MVRASNPEALERLLERLYPDHSVEKQGEEHMVSCPFCDSSKDKLAINPGKGVFQCWVCGERGPVHKLLAHLVRLGVMSKEDQSNILKGKGTVHLSDKLRPVRKREPKIEQLWTEHIPCVFPPKTFPITGFRPHSVLEARMHGAVVQYLASRHVDEKDIERYKLQFCVDLGSRYHGHIFFPVLGRYGRQLTFWTTRSIIPDAVPKSLHAGKKYSRFTAKLILANEHLVDGSTIALCEGPFDAHSIMKVMGIPACPLLGKNLHFYHRTTIEDLGIKTVYICLDPDAIKTNASMAALMPEVQVKHVLLEDGDPNDVSPEKLKAAFEEAKNATEFTKWYRFKDYFKQKTAKPAS
jgi:Zn finger protein HypA/HybF involved in hydrogenase expression